MVQSVKKFKKVFYINQFSYTPKMIYILDFFIFQTLIQEKLLRLCLFFLCFHGQIWCSQVNKKIHIDR